MRLSQTMMIAIYEEFWRAAGEPNFQDCETEILNTDRTNEQRQWLREYSAEWERQSDAAGAAFEELGGIMYQISDWLVGAGYDALAQEQIDCARDLARMEEACGMFADLRDRVGIPAKFADTAIRLVRAIHADIF